MRSKVRVAQDGTHSGGCRFSRGALYKILANQIYVGEVPHHKLSHPGQHRAIIERELWERVRRRLREQTVRTAASSAKVNFSPLAGKLFDERGERLVASHTLKRGRRYRYYVSRADIDGKAQAPGGAGRLPALEIERTVAAEVGKVLDNVGGLACAAHESGIGAEQIPTLLEAASAGRERLVSDLNTAAALLERAELMSDGVRIFVNLQPLLAGNGETTSSTRLIISRVAPLQMKRRGVELRLVIEGRRSSAASPDVALLKAIARARSWFDELRSGRSASLSALAVRAGVRRRYVNYLLPLAFLAPDIVEAIASGRQPAELTAQTLIKRVDLPLEWAAQKRLLGMR